MDSSKERRPFSEVRSGSGRLKLTSEGLPFIVVLMEADKKRAICGICSAGCWVRVTYDREGKIDVVEPDEGSPLGKICRLGERSREIVYSPNRLFYPLRRKGPKGTFDFERISWDEAYDSIVAKLQAIKAESGRRPRPSIPGAGASSWPCATSFSRPGWRFHRPPASCSLSARPTPLA